MEQASERLSTNRDIFLDSIERWSEDKHTLV